MIERRVAIRPAALGGAALIVTLGWWWVVFRTLIGTGLMTLPAALPCLARNFDLCVLAHALCSSSHWLGIRHYDNLLFWCSAGVMVASILVILRQGRVMAASAPVSRS